MPNEFVMRGKTVSGKTETLNFRGRTPGYGYQLTEFKLFPSINIISQVYELCGAITADDSAEDPVNPNFDNPGVIATAIVTSSTSQPASEELVVINDIFAITQDLILKVQNTHGEPINWQCRFKKVKLSDAAEAVANFKQFTIFDG